MNTRILVIVAVMIIIVVGFFAYPLAVTDDAEAHIIQTSNIPDSWSTPCTITIGVKLKNMGSFGHLSARIIDRDLVGPWQNDVGWAASKLAVSYLTAVVAPTYNLPGANGADSDFHGRIQAGHLSGGTYYIDHTYDFTIPYTPAPPVNHAPTASQPAGPLTGEVDTMYTFFTNTNDQDGDIVDCKWNFGDGTITNWGSSTIQHSWSNADTYYIKVKPRDSEGLEGEWSPNHAITINDLTPSPPTPSPPGTYTVNIYVKTADTGEPIEDVTVIMDSTTKTTDLNGYTNFAGVTKGSHSFSFEKEGYRSYSSDYTIVTNSNINIKLSPQGIPGFEFLSILVALGVILIFMKRRL